MKLITKQLPDSHNLFLFGDVHLGSVLSSISGWNKLVEMMNSGYEGCFNNYGIDGGDMIEAIMVDDSRFSPEMLTEPLPLEQMKKAIEARQPIKDKLLCILMGNHERKLWRFGNITEKVCQELGVEYGTVSAKLTIRDTEGKLLYKIYETHGYKGLANIRAGDPIQRYANMRVSLKRQLKDQMGDCAVMIKHHAHKLIVSKPESELYLVDTGKKIKQAYTEWGQNESYIHPDARWYGCAGSFLRLFGDGISGYAEIMEYPPNELGFLILKVREGKIISLDPYYLKI